MSQQLTTGYKAAQIVNAILEANGHKTVPPQLVYQYMANGMIKSYEDGSINARTNKPNKFVDLNGDDHKDFSQWIVRYMARKGIVYSDMNENARQATSEQMQDVFARIGAAYASESE